MKTENLNIKANNLEINNAISSFCPFGSMDIAAAVNAALQAGKDTDFVFDSVNKFAENCGNTIDKCDPVYCVLDAILQEARNEISEICNFDFLDDIKYGYIETYGNFMCSSYTCSGDSKNELINILSLNNVNIEDLSESTQYFLDAIEIYTEDIKNTVDL